MNNNLHDEIHELISLGAEGEYWDFKQKWHTNKADLLHDIICMANNLTNRDAYIIIGVSDSQSENGIEIISVSGDQKRKNQQELITFLRDKKFFGGVRPTVYLETICFDNGEVDVIIVKNTNKTPYYLLDDFKEGGHLHSHHVYTRIGDTNTPKDKTADSDKVEYLWKKRFGLNLPVFSLAKLLLNESENWVYRYDEIADTIIFHHKIRQDFTVEIVDVMFDENKIKKPNFWLFYLYNALGVKIHPKIYFKNLSIKYHTTVLYEDEIISSDEGEYTTVYFENKTFYQFKYDGGFNTGLVIAYLILNSDKACIYNFINGQFNKYEKGMNDKRDVEEVVLFFDDEEEKTEFFDMVNTNSSEFLKFFEAKTPPTIIPKDNDDAYDIGMSLRASKILTEWLQKWKINKLFLS